MGELKEQIIRLIEQNAAKQVAELAHDFVRAKSGQKEAIVAGIEFERWLSESCRECLG